MRLLTSLRGLALSLVTSACLLWASAPAYADSVIWGNSATFGSANLEAFNIAPDGTVTLLQQFLLPNLTARAGNGRGVALLGTTIYYTIADSGKIWVTDSVSHADLGILVDTGFPGIANVATDGIYIYASSYQDSSGHINRYDTAGVFIDQITVGPGFFGRDGFEVQNNPNLDGGATTYISNRGDLVGPYDVYKADGTLLVSAFINPSADGLGNGVTGIAYDGTNYFVSDIRNNRLFQYDGTGNFVQIIDLSGIAYPFGSFGRLLEDLSALGNTTSNQGGGEPVPEPSTLLLFGMGAAILVGRRLRQRSA